MSKSIPKFKNEDAEQDFWSEHDSSEYLDWKKAEHVMFPNLKPSTKSISLRLPESLLDALRQMANERDVPYQSLIKMILQERIEQDLMRLVPQGQWTLFSHWLIWHGRRRCFARKPQCGQCELRELCPARDLEK